MVIWKGERASQKMVDSMMVRDIRFCFSLGLIPSAVPVMYVRRGQDLSDDQLLRVAKTLGQEWEQAAIHLKLSITDLDTIKAERQGNVSMQKLKMLVLWKNRRPRGEATAQHLLSSLEDLQDLSCEARQILEVHERLVAVVQCSASTGQAFVQLLTEVFQHLKLDGSMCIGNATDGASNMQGQYKGFSALLATQSPTHVHVWCYAHVLNLVLADTTQIVIESGSLFGLLNDTAVFIRESYQRMNLWEKESQDKRHKRIAPIGATCWWAKHDALKKVYGSFGKPQDSLYVDVLFTLTSIQEQKTAKSNIRTKARGYKEGLL
ncbi:hypothetical protein NHX12_008828, partial [Muraenolepis orangiensis]